ncbi:MAG: hypothetical protein Q8922_07085 [Bacteroidota bacterium]|nr:hypothetical protein [Bacteroidota bacterium]MDP4287684.1 hypothetical protein [Bacteroidota bacterium]
MLIQKRPLVRLYRQARSALQSLWLHVLPVIPRLVRLYHEKLNQFASQAFRPCHLLPNRIWLLRQIGLCSSAVLYGYLVAGNSELRKRIVFRSTTVLAMH